MSDSYFSRLNWIKPDIPAAAVSTAAGAAHLVGAEKPPPAGAAPPVPGEPLMSALERALWTVGLPIGSTPEAQSSPLLEARDLLRAAAEIEHGLLVQYLYAAYSTSNIVIRGTIAQIAREEMGHLISVQNFLLALGGPPHFDRDHYPTTPGPGETFPFALTFEPLSLNSLAKYVTAESPPLETIQDAALKARLQPVIDTGKVAAHQMINHVGMLYVALFWLFQSDDAVTAIWPNFPVDMVLAVHRKLGRTNWHIPSDAFTPQADLVDLQADPDLEDWTKADDRILARAVAFGADGKVDRNSILTPLFEIAEQGEGWELPTGGEESHFMRFLEKFESLKALADAGTPLPVANVPTNPTTVNPPAPSPAPEELIDNPEAKLWAQIFNTRYRIVLLKLALVVASRRSQDAGTPDGRRALILDVIPIEMKTNLRTLAQELIKMRRTGIPSGGPEPRRAAPPFELPKGSLPSLVGLDPDPKVAERAVITLLRQAIKEALKETAELVQAVKAQPADVLDNPSNRSFLTDVLLHADQPLLAALG